MLKTLFREKSRSGCYQSWKFRPRLHEQIKHAIFEQIRLELHHSYGSRICSCVQGLTRVYVYRNIYIYICACVCVCVSLGLLGRDCIEHFIYKTKQIALASAFCRFHYFQNDTCFVNGNWSISQLLDFSKIPSITAVLGGNFDPLIHLEQQRQFEDIIEAEQSDADLQPGRRPILPLLVMSYPALTRRTPMLIIHNISSPEL